MKVVHTLFSPEGATLGNQGREPLVMEKHKTMSPRRGTTLHMTERSVALPGLVTTINIVALAATGPGGLQ